MMALVPVPAQLFLQAPAELPLPLTPIRPFHPKSAVSQAYARREPGGPCASRTGSHPAMGSDIALSSALSSRLRRQTSGPCTSPFHRHGQRLVLPSSPPQQDRLGHGHPARLLRPAPQSALPHPVPGRRVRTAGKPRGIGCRTALAHLPSRAQAHSSRYRVGRPAGSGAHFALPGKARGHHLRRSSGDDEVNSVLGEGLSLRPSRRLQPACRPPGRAQ